jgi:cyclase
MKAAVRTAVVACVSLVTVPAFADDLPKMQFNEVKEIAPSVFFRYSSISATDQTVPFGGSNNIWVVFKDYVVVFDANFPKEAGDVLAAVRKTTDKPVRYVIDSHHHGDHAYGNAVFAAAGANVIASANADRWLREKGPKEFADAGRGPTGRKDVRDSSLKAPDVILDQKLVLDDGTQRVEILFLGHAHTPGDVVAFLPKHGLLCTGDACVNGAFNYSGHADTASWVKVLEKMQQLDVKRICPGHGPVAGKDLLEKQKRYWVELRQHVRKGIDAGQEFADIRKGLDLPWYKEWTGVEARSRDENVRRVYDELTGKVAPSGLGAAPGRAVPGWATPRRIVVPNLMPARLLELKRLAPDVEFVPVRTAADAARAAADADAVLGFCTPEVLRAGSKLRWVQAGDDGIDRESPRPGGVLLTDLRRLPGTPDLAERPWLVFRENVRRFVAGEGLLGVVD